MTVELFEKIEQAKRYWWDGSPDGEFYPLAVEIGIWCVTNEGRLSDALEVPDEG